MSSDADPARQAAVDRLEAQRGLVRLAGTALGVCVLLVVIWALSGAGYFWPMWAMFGFAVALVGGAWRAYGPRQRPITDADIEREMHR